jgi:bifunctional non-homologous end joining protein LigD
MLESAVLPRIHPMRLRIAKPFDDPEYIFELKHDVFRARAYVEEGKCRRVSRNSNLLKSFQALKESLGKLRVQNAILDGEIICIDRNGISQFNQLFSRQGIPVFYAFDLLWLNHEDFRNLPLIERKQRLRKLIERNRPERIIYAQHVEREGKLLFEEICNNDLEGCVIRRSQGDSHRLPPGERRLAWARLRSLRRANFTSCSHSYPANRKGTLASVRAPVKCQASKQHAQELRNKGEFEYEFEYNREGLWACF